jgi:hypothetical protein
MKGLFLILLLLFPACILHAQWANGLLPDYAKIQHAGSIGFMSAGAGYEFFNDKLEAELLYGHVPGRFGGPLDIVTARLVFNPVIISVSPSVSVVPLNFSGFVTYHFGDQFWIKLPSYYYEGYYKWSSAIRYHAGFGTMISYRHPQSGHGCALYYELNSNDLYLKSLKANSTLNLADVLSLGVGVKIY